MLNNNEILNQVPNTYSKQDINNIKIMVDSFYTNIFDGIKKESIYQPFVLSDFSEDEKKIVDLSILLEIDEFEYN